MKFVMRLIMDHDELVILTIQAAFINNLSHFILGLLDALKSDTMSIMNDVTNFICKCK